VIAADAERVAVYVDCDEWFGRKRGLRGCQSHVTQFPKIVFLEQGGETCMVSFDSLPTVTSVTVHGKNSCMCVSPWSLPALSGGSREVDMSSDCSAGEDMEDK
jgi:hypothetical protein